MAYLISPSSTVLPKGWQINTSSNSIVLYCIVFIVLLLKLVNSDRSYRTFITSKSSEDDVGQTNQKVLSDVEGGRGPYGVY